MQGKTLYTILLAIIAVLTLALAVLVIFMFTLSSKNVNDPGKQQGKEHVVPLEEQAEFKLYPSGDDTGKTEGLFNIKPEGNSNSYLMASVSIIYDAGKKQKFLEDRKALLEKNISQMKEATIEYFRGKTKTELMAENAMQTARESLREIYATIIGEDPDSKIILKVVLTNWIVQ